MERKISSCPPSPPSEESVQCVCIPRGRFNSARLCCNPQAPCGGMAEWESASLLLVWVLPSFPGCSVVPQPCALPGQCAARGAAVGAQGSLCLPGALQGPCPGAALRCPAASLRASGKVRVVDFLDLDFKKSRGIKYMFFCAVACVRAVHRKAEGVLRCLMLCCRLVPAQPGSYTRAFGSLCLWSPCSRHRHWFVFSLCTLFC